MTEPELVTAFHTLWDSFPTRVRLIRKDRTVVAVNRAAVTEGLTTGVRCVDTPPAASHKGCLANLALKEGMAKYSLTQNGARLRFWIPIDGSDDLFVHFSLETAAFLPPSKDVE